MGTDIELSLSSEEVKVKVREILSRIDHIQSDWKRISTIIDYSQGYWQGEAGRVFRQSKKSMETDMESVLARMRKYPRDYLELEGIMEESEKEDASASQSLPDHIIF